MERAAAVAIGGDPGSRRMVGEYAPPREIVAVDVARVTGKGALEVGPGGLTFDGALQGVPSRLPVWGSAAVLAVAAVVAVILPNGEQIAMPGVLVAIGGLLWLRLRAEVGVAGTYRVAWSGVEHVVRLASPPDTVAFVLAGPVAGPGSPESVYFAPSEGVEALAEALRAHAPAGLAVELAAPPEAPDAPDEPDV